MSDRQIIVDLNTIFCLASAVSAREYVETAKKSIPMMEPCEHYFSLYHQMSGRAPGFSHPQLYAVLSALFGESTTLYDDYKCSFAYPFLLKIFRKDKVVDYLFTFRDYKGFPNFNLRKISSAFDKDIDNTVIKIMYDPIEDDFSRDEMSSFMTEFVLYIIEFSDPILEGYNNEFSRSIDYCHMIYGFRNDTFFIDRYNDSDEFYQAKLDKRRLRFTDTERRRLAALAYPLDRKVLRAVATVVTPDTLVRWYRQLIAQKFDGSNNRNGLGRPRVPDDVEQLVIRMANENPTWGYRRIQGALANLGYHIDKITVRNILPRHHIEPAPTRRQGGMSWSKFLKIHWAVLAATDFFTVEVATWQGLVTYYVLVVMELHTRQVHIAGISPHPHDVFMTQCARQLTDHFDGFLLGKHYIIHDRDSKFTQTFDQYLRDNGVEPIVLPPRSPNLKAHCERFVRSIKEEALDHVIIMGEASLRYLLNQYLTHYHTERNHQGLSNQRIEPETVRDTRDDVLHRERIGGLLSYYHREAA